MLGNLPVNILDVGLEGSELLCSIVNDVLPNIRVKLARINPDWCAFQVLWVCYLAILKQSLHKLLYLICINLSGRDILSTNFHGCFVTTLLQDRVDAVIRSSSNNACTFEQIRVDHLHLSCHESSTAET